MAEIGSIGVGAVHSVSLSGQICLIDGGPVVHWGVRADDRWHVARDERAIRQGIAEDGVSIETRLRIPGGDAVHRISSTPFKNTSVTVVEVENETPVPIAVALFIYGQGVWECDGDTLYKDRVPFLRADKPIADFRVAISEKDLMRAVQLDEMLPDERSLAVEKGSYVAVIFPVPHTTSLRFITQIETNHNSLPALETLPSLGEIAKGWFAHFDQAAIAEVHEERIQNALLSARRHLLTGSEQTPTSPYWTKGVPEYAIPVSIVALCAWGHKTASKRLLLQLINDKFTTTLQRSSTQETCYFLWACKEYVLMQQDDEEDVIIARAIEQVVNLIEMIPRWGLRRRRNDLFLHLGLESSVYILRKAQQQEEAQNLEEALPKIYRRNPITQKDSLSSALINEEDCSKRLLQYLNGYINGSRGIGTFDESIVRTGGTGVFASHERTQDPFASALFLLALHRALVSRSGRNRSAVALFPGYSPRWFNIPVEVSAMPSGNSKIGYAVRWHGNRPALLWEGQSEEDLMFIAPGFDKDWQSLEIRGEALFSPQEPEETALPLISPSTKRNSDASTNLQGNDGFS